MRTEWQQPNQPLTRTVHWPSGDWSARVPVLFIRWTDAEGLEIIDVMGLNLRMGDHEMFLEVAE